MGYSRGVVKEVHTTEQLNNNNNYIYIYIYIFLGNHKPKTHKRYTQKERNPNIILRIVIKSQEKEEKLDHLYAEESNWTTFSHIKINSKWTKGLNVSPQAIKLREENIGSTLFHIALSNIFLDMSPQAREIKAKINK